MKRLWIAFAVVMVFSFSVLGWVGTRIYQEAPPLPDQVIATDGKVVIPSGDIGKGQNVWQAMGGMQVGSIWGHGSYVAPDWSADWLHRECVFILNEWANTSFQKNFDHIDPEQQAAEILLALKESRHPVQRPRFNGTIGCSVASTPRPPAVLVSG